MTFKEAIKVTFVCNYNFGHYPFDYHECDFDFGAAANTIESLNMNSTRVRHENQRLENGQGILSINDSNLPFDIFLESLKPFELFQGGFTYSFARMKIHLNRNDFEHLLGSYYGPTFIFSLLSLISYAINPDVVSLKKTKWKYQIEKPRLKILIVLILLHYFKMFFFNIKLVSIKTIVSSQIM